MVQNEKSVNLVLLLLPLEIRLTLGQGKKECTSLFQSGFKPNNPSIHFYNLINNSQTDTSAFRFVPAVKGWKYLKNPLLKQRREKKEYWILLFGFK